MIRVIKVVMTVLWISVAVGPIAADFNDTHLFNPLWPPHARLHMMTVFTTAVSIAIFGFYLCWAPAASQLDNLRSSALLGFLYSAGLVVACLTMPLYGGSLYWTDVTPRAARISDANLIVFACVTVIFAALAIVLFSRIRWTTPGAGS